MRVGLERREASFQISCKSFDIFKVFISETKSSDSGKTGGTKSDDRETWSTRLKTVEARSWGNFS